MTTKSFIPVGPGCILPRRPAVPNPIRFENRDASSPRAAVAVFESCTLIVVTSFWTCCFVIGLGSYDSHSSACLRRRASSVGFAMV